MCTLLSYQNQCVTIDPFLTTFMGFPVFLAVLSFILIYFFILCQVISNTY